MQLHGCKSCVFACVNASKKDIESQHYCVEALGSDGYYTWGTPMFRDMGDDVWYTVTNEMAIRSPEIDSNGKPECSFFKPATYKLVVGADIGDDNGIFDGGIFNSVEEAITYEEKEFAYKYHEFYGAFVEVVETGRMLAASNGYWKQTETDTHYWHCPLL
jgi:hypothetical protein